MNNESLFVESMAWCEDKSHSCITYWTRLHALKYASQNWQLFHVDIQTVEYNPSIVGLVALDLPRHHDKHYCEEQETEHGGCLVGDLDKNRW